jgi:pyruvate kinase
LLSDESTPIAKFLRTKVVSTIGPASDADDILLRMIKAGMNIARLNFSHGTHEEHLLRIQRIRKAASEARRNVGLLQDLPGPKLRVGKMKDGGALLKPGQDFDLSPDTTEGNNRVAPISYLGLAKDVKTGDTIFLADGSIKLRVKNTSSGTVQCEVVVGGFLKSNKGINVPGVFLNVPSVTPEDLDHLKFGLENDVDFVALSFVRDPTDVEEVGRFLRSKNSRNEIFLVCKIEKFEAVLNFDALLQVTDGVMVARGDLGVEIPIESVPIIQKELIRKSNSSGKPVIVATQMLESMVENPFPTRAEVTDVSNAIFEGADGVMTSEETAIGKYPVEAVEMLSRIARATESRLPYQRMLQVRRPSVLHTPEDVISLSACEAALGLDAKVIVAPTNTGSTPARVSRFRPRSIILALTPSEKVVRKLQIFWGVHALKTEVFTTTDEMFRVAEQSVLQNEMAQKGDTILVTAGTPGLSGTTDVLKLIIIGSSSQTTKKVTRGFTNIRKIQGL